MERVSVVVNLFRRSSIEVGDRQWANNSLITFRARSTSRLLRNKRHKLPKLFLRHNPVSRNCRKRLVSSGRGMITIHRRMHGLGSRAFKRTSWTIICCFTRVFVCCLFVLCVLLPTWQVNAFVNSARTTGSTFGIELKKTALMTHEKATEQCEQQLALRFVTKTSVVRLNKHREYNKNSFNLGRS